MSQPQKLLFICSQNVQRSLTAERLLDGAGGYQVLSAGTESAARVHVTEELVDWADIIFVMEPKHVQALRKGFKKALAGKRLICLQIPDCYGFMNARLVELFKEKLALYINVPRLNRPATKQNGTPTSQPNPTRTPGPAQE